MKTIDLLIPAPEETLPLSPKTKGVRMGYAIGGFEDFLAVLPEGSDQIDTQADFYKEYCQAFGIEDGLATREDFLEGLAVGVKHVRHLSEEQIANVRAQLESRGDNS